MSSHSLSSRSADDASPEEEVYSTIAAFQSIDEDYYKNKSSADPTLGKVISWPPVENYKIIDEGVRFSLSGRSEGVGIYAANLECRKALESVAFGEWLQSMGVSTFVRSKTADCSILVYIKTSVCERPESYEIQIRQNKIIIIAADFVGVVYALNTFKDLLTFNSTTSFEDDVKTLSLPLLLVSDAPAVRHRCVQWSYQFHIFSSKAHPSTSIRLLAKLKINTIFLSMEQSLELYPPTVDALAQIQSEVSAFVDLANNFQIDLIPVLYVRSDQNWLDQATVVKTVFSGKVLVVFELAAQVETTANSDASALYNRVLRDLQQSHLTSILVAKNPYAQEAIAADAYIANEGDIPVQSWSYNSLNAPELRRKPIVLMREIIHDMTRFGEEVRQRHLLHQHTTAIEPADSALVLPLHADRDFLCPDIVAKYTLALFASVAAFGGQRSASVFESPAFVAYLKALMPQILPVSSDPHHKDNNHAMRETLLALMHWRQPLNSEVERGQHRVEQTLWSLYLMADEVSPAQLPSAEEALAAYRLYRSVLQQAQYRLATQKMFQNRGTRLKQGSGRSHANSLASLVSTSSGTSSSSATGAVLTEVEEFFAVVDLLCMLARTIYLATSLAQSTNNNGNNAAVNGLSAQAALTAAAMQSDALSNNNNNINAQALAAQQYNKRAAVYDNVDMSKPYAPKVIPKTPEISALLTRVVQQNILFRNFASEEHASIVEAFECVTAKAGEIVIKQGDSGEYFYIIEQGHLDVFMESCGVRIKVGRDLGVGDYFGELALMYNTPRAATVISTSASVLWRIDRTTYRSIVTHHNKITSDEFFALVSNVSILGKRLGDVLSSAELSKVVSTLEIEEFEPGAVIIRQHQTGDYFYIISSGQVDVFQEKTGPSHQPFGQQAHQQQSIEYEHKLGNRVATLSRGDCFGEKALLADDVRQASCVAVDNVTVLSLSRDDFIAMIGSWQDVADNGASHMQKLLMQKKAKLRASVYDSQYHLTIRLDELEKLNTLGEGAFGKVFVARHKASAQLYALKCQAKAFICAQGMQEMVLNEVGIMKQLDHPLITKLHAVIQDRTYIYFLLELLPGGEFFSFLQGAGKLSEDKARFYAASVVLALEELHKAKIAYRDLKPENMVMDARGYVKLVDFGLAKQVVSGSTWTMCGTPDYLAPEIILNKGHNHAVDYWALGVLIFEMIHGWPPFYHDQPMKVYEKIITGKVDYPATFTKALEDIVSKFLVKNPSKRLGNVKGGIADITKHKWFGSFDWRGLMAGTLLAPSMPNLSAFDAAVAAEGEDESDEDDDDASERHEESDWTPDLF